MDRIGVYEFAKGCLRLLDQVQLTGEPIEIIKDGQLLAVIIPPPPPTKSRKAAYGAMKHTLTGPVGDLITPFDENDWEVLQS